LLFNPSVYQETAPSKWQGECFVESRPEFRLKSLEIRRRLAMKITYMSAARGLLFLAACLPAAAQANLSPTHRADGSSQISAGAPETQVKALQRQLESYEQQLRAKAEQVENAQQEAISAGIQGDGAGPFIDAYLQEQRQLEALQAALAPQMERTRTMIANLTMPAPRSDSAPTRKLTPAPPAGTVVAGGNSGERTQSRNRTIASGDSSKLNPAAK
jgi:hypothetical protein